MKKYEHGGSVDKNKIQYDFSVNVNPMGLPESVSQVLQEQIHAFTCYPDPHCIALRTAIAEHEHIKASQVVCGNGAAELIYKLLAVKKPKRVLIPAPAFVEYEKAVLECGGQVVYYDMPEPFVLTEDIIPVLTQQDIDMIILCSPNNPTGQLIEAGLLQRIKDVCIEYDVILLLDACFMGFVNAQLPQSIITTSKQVVILKAFTKLYAMAGLRLGYMLCRDAALLDEVQTYGPCWNVSVPAQLAGLAALKETSYVEETKKLIEEERTYLENTLGALGVRVYPSHANFILFYCKTPIMAGLRQAGIAIRSCENYRGLGKGYYRIAVRSHAENVFLIEALTRILENKNEELAVWQK